MTSCRWAAATICLRPLQVDNIFVFIRQVVVVVVEIFVHGAVKATVTNAPQSQLNK